MTLFQKLAGVCLAISLQACVSGPKYTAMTQETNQKIDNSSIYVFVHQDEIRPAVKLMNSSAALGGGLIGAVIDSSNNDNIAANAMDVTLPLYREIVDFDFREVLMNELNPVFADKFKAGELPASASSIHKNQKQLMAEVKKLSEGEAHIFSNVFYQFADNSKLLQTTISVYMFLPNAKPSLSKPDYYNVFHYQSSQVGEGGEDSIAKWASNGGELFRNEMTNSARVIAQNLEYDLQTSRQEQCIKGGKARIWNSLGGLTSKGQVIKEQDDRLTVRLNNSAIMSSPSALITDASVKECAKAE